MAGIQAAMMPNNVSSLETAQLVKRMEISARVAGEDEKSGRTIPI